MLFYFITPDHYLFWYNLLKFILDKTKFILCTLFVIVKAHRCVRRQIEGQSVSVSERIIWSHRMEELRLWARFTSIFACLRDILAEQYFPRHCMTVYVPYIFKHSGFYSNSDFLGRAIQNSQKTWNTALGQHNFIQGPKEMRNAKQHWNYACPIFQGNKARSERIGRHSSSCLACYW